MNAAETLVSMRLAVCNVVRVFLTRVAADKVLTFAPQASMPLVVLLLLRPIGAPGLWGKPAWFTAVPTGKRAETIKSSNNRVLCQLCPIGDKQQLSNPMIEGLTLSRVWDQFDPRHRDHLLPTR